MKCQRLLVLSFVHAVINARPQNGNFSGDSVFEDTTQTIQDSNVTVAGLHDSTPKLTEDLQKWNFSLNNFAEGSPNEDLTEVTSKNEKGEPIGEVPVNEGLSGRNLLGVLSAGSGRGLLQGIIYGLTRRLLRLQILNFILGGGKLPSLSRGGLVDGILKGDLERGLLGGLLKGVLGPGVLSGPLNGGLGRGLLSGILKGITSNEILSGILSGGLFRPLEGLLGRKVIQRPFKNLNLGGILNLKNTTKNTPLIENLLSNNLNMFVLRLELLNLLFGAAKLIDLQGNKSTSGSLRESGLSLGNLRSGPLLGGLGERKVPLLDGLEGELLFGGTEEKPALGGTGGKPTLEDLGGLEKLLGGSKRPLRVLDNPLGGLGGLLSGLGGRKLSPISPETNTINIDDILKVHSLIILLSREFLNELLKLDLINAILGKGELGGGFGGELLDGLGNRLLGGFGSDLSGGLLGGLGSGLTSALLGGLGSSLTGGILEGLGSGISGGILGGLGSGISGGILGGLGSGISGGILGGLGSGISGGILGGLGSGISGGLLGGLGSGISGGLLRGLGSGISGGGLLGGLGNSLTDGLLKRDIEGEVAGTANNLLSGLISGRSSRTESDLKGKVKLNGSKDRDEDIFSQPQIFDETEVVNAIFGKLRYSIRDSYRTLQFRRGFDLTHGISSGWSNFQKNGKVIITEDELGREIFGFDVLFPRIEVQYRIQLLKGILGRLLLNLLQPIPPSENPLLHAAFRNVKIFIIIRPNKGRADLLDFIIKRTDAEPVISITSTKLATVPQWIQALMLPLVEVSLQKTAYDGILKAVGLAIRNTKISVLN